MTVAPNPSSDIVNVSVVAPEGIATVGVFDATGQQLMEHEVLLRSAGASVFTLDVSSLSSGQYYVRIAFEGGADIRPLAVLR